MSLTFLAALSKSSKGKSAKKSQAETKESDEKDEEEKALERSEEMMKAFLTATGGEEEETNKSERTRTIIKTIKVSLDESFTYNPGFLLEKNLRGKTIGHCFSEQ